MSRLCNHRLKVKTCRRCGEVFVAPGQASICRPCVDIRREQQMTAYNDRRRKKKVQQ